MKRLGLCSFRWFDLSTTRILAAGLLSAAPNASLLAEEPATGRTIQVMSYNVENLFDAEHDAGKDDWTYLPRNYPGKAEYCRSVPEPVYREECEQSDWTNDRFELKLRQTAVAVRESRQRLPEILALVEVENPNVVARLAGALGYDEWHMTNSPDKRGIDCAIMFNTNANMSFVQWREHEMTDPIFDRKPTRNILEAEFLVDGREKLFVYVNHWTAASAPGEFRVKQAQRLMEVMQTRMRSTPGAHLLIVGDLNTIPGEVPHAYHDVLIAANAPVKLVDIVAESGRRGRRGPPGTFFFARDMSWNFLDHPFGSANLTDGRGLEVKIDRFHVHAPRLLTKTFEYTREGYFSGSRVTGTPKKYNMAATTESEAGFSDHFPVVVTLSY